MTDEHWVKVEYDGFEYEKIEGMDSMACYSCGKYHEDVQGYLKILCERGLTPEEVKKKMQAFLEQY